MSNTAAGIVGGTGVMPRGTFFFAFFLMNNFFLIGKSVVKENGTHDHDLLQE